ncbi:MAG: hypothetical protein QF619_09025 [Candidatus Binatia bacterium]|nr:hypothetical protein [Candidatus Binatia bacterium]
MDQIWKTFGPCSTARHTSPSRTVDLSTSGDCLHMFGDNFPRTEANKTLESEKDYQDIIQLAQDGNEVGENIRGHEHIGRY